MGPIEIEHACLVDSNQAIHFIRPRSSATEASQYVFAFADGYEGDGELFFVRGHALFDALAACLSSAADHLADKDLYRRVVFRADARYSALPNLKTFDGAASIEVRRTHPWLLPSTFDIAIQVHKTSSTNGPSATAASQNQEGSLSLCRDGYEARSIGRMIRGLADAQFETIFTSSRVDWFLPGELELGSELHNLGRRARVETAISHIFAECHERQFAIFWARKLRQLEFFPAGTCTECQNFFHQRVDEVKWKKKCTGCHISQTSSGYAGAQLASAEVMRPWLTGGLRP